jgi:hypothetical protein
MMDKRLFVVDNFYANPDDVRNFALGVNYDPSSEWYKGKRSKEQYNFPGIQEAFESIMGRKLKPLNEHGMCGRFQLLTSEDPIVYHYDTQQWAGMIYLTPDAPVGSGTSLYKSKITGARRLEDPRIDESFPNGFYDSSQFELMDQIGNVYNRLVIMDARCIHSASMYFGNNDNNCRLTHLFFFDHE